MKMSITIVTPVLGPFRSSTSAKERFLFMANNPFYCLSLEKRESEVIDIRATFEHLFFKIGWNTIIWCADLEPQQMNIRWPAETHRCCPSVHFYPHSMNCPGTILFRSFSNSMSSRFLQEFIVRFFCEMRVWLAFKNRCPWRGPKCNRLIKGRYFP